MQRGNYQTRQQEAVAALFERSPEACMTADEAYRKLLDTGMDVGKTTVYRAYVHLARFDEAAADALMEQAKGQYEGDSLFLFEAAQYHARKCEYSKAIAYYEYSFAAEENHKPRFTDALEAIAAIYETMGDYRQAADAWGRMITLLRDEWGFTDCVTMQTAEEERARLLQMV